MQSLLPEERIIDKIVILRWQKVILDKDLAELYGVETKYLKRQVSRNIGRFPEDFMFTLTKEEVKILRWHFGTLKQWSHSKYLSQAFTEHGILMLSSVLRSKKAIAVNIQIIRVFNKMRKLLETNEWLLEKVEGIEKQLLEHNEELAQVRFAIKQLLRDEEEPKRIIWFRAD